MRLSATKLTTFFAFTACFAVLAGFVFGGTWGLSVAPVMPDHPVSYPLNYLETWVHGWLTTGKFVPSDVIVFLGSPYFWLELKYALALYCAALGMAYFLRGHGLPRVSAYGAGLLLAFSGYWCTLFSAGHFGWFQWMTYGVFAFGLIDRALTKGKLRHWLLLGAVLAWGSFYQPDLWLLFTLFEALYFVFRLLSLKALSLRVVKGGALALLAFTLIGLPSFRSAIVTDLAGRERQITQGETVSDAVTDEAAKRWIFVTNWSMPPEDTLEFFCEGIKGDTSCPMTLAIGQHNKTKVQPYTGRLGRPFHATQGNYRQHSLYVGWVTCLLALVGSVIGVRRRTGTVIFFLSAALAFWLISMGRYCEPIYRLIYALPMGDYLRAPVKWHHLTEFSLVVLAGYGLAFAQSKLRTFPVLVVILVGAINLAVSAQTFCAPRLADADLQVIDLRVLQNRQVRQQMRKEGIQIAGALPQQGIALVAVPHPRETQPLEPYEPNVLVLSLGILSLLSSLGVMGVALGSVCRRHPHEG